MDPRWLLALAWLAGFTLIDSSIVSLALPDIANDFDRTVGQLAWVSTGYLLALAATLLAAGRLSDRYGQRPVLAGGAIGFFVATLACGLAPTYELLVALRVVQGIFGGILYTVSLAITVTAFPPERRASAIGIYFTSGALGAVIGPVVGGFLTDLGGWRLVFLAQLPLPFVVALGAVVLLPRVTRRTGPFDIAGIASASLLVVATTFAMLQLAEPGGATMAAVAALVAVGALVAFLVIERRVPDPAVKLSIFGNARFVVATVAGAGAWFAIMSATIYTALYLQLAREFSAADAGLILLAAPLVALIGFPFGGRFVRAVGVDRANLIGVSLMLLGSAFMLTWGADTPVWWVVGTGLVTGAGIAVTLVASATDALAQFRPEDAGTGSALFNSLRQFGAAMGVAVPAVAFELVASGSRSAAASLEGSTAAFAIRTTVLAVPLILVALGWRRRRQRAGEPLPA
ncbi:MAG: MFS transporter [Chloroflexi bacterium]|nr:MFS transporter [Chloroflexota bacterium]